MNSNLETNPNNSSNRNKTIDRLIFGFVLIFVVSLTNSIFINQIGYFFALILMLARLLIIKENRFEKTGLEIPFILFLSAELISAILSIDQPQALTIFFKRLILIPIVYIIAAATDSIEKAKTLFKFYIGAALITITIYIVFAYDHFITQLYQLESRGPSPFQFVMTAGGLMSFTVIFLFAFLVNEKVKIKFKVLILTAFIIASVALFASYTRAAWIGAAAGILFVLILKRRWIILGLGFILLFLIIFTSRNVSNVYEFKIENDKLEKISEFPTEGRPFNLYTITDTLVIADYENGISIRTGNKEIQHIETISPITGFKKWTDNYFIGYLDDSRILLIEKDSKSSLKITKEFTSPGKTVDYKIFNNNLYVQDVDSGLTIFTNPQNIKENLTLHEFTGIKSFNIDSTWFAGFDPIKNSLYLYSVKNGMPIERIDSIYIKSGIGLIWIYKKYIYFQSEKEFARNDIIEGETKKTASIDLTGIFKLYFEDSKIIAASLTGKVYEIYSDSSSQLDFKEIADLGFTPTDFLKEGNKIYFTQIKRNRLTSIFDPHHDTNIERLAQWRTGWKILIDHPLFGVGDIDLKDIYSRYKDYYLKENFGHLHNNYIHFLVILGFAGFVCVIFMLTKIFLLHLRIYRSMKDIDFISSYSLGAFAAFVGFLVSGLAEWNFGDQEIITMVWFTLGLNIAFYKNYVKSRKVEPGVS